MASLITNDRRVNLRVANFLIDSAGQMHHVENGKAMSPKQDDDNDFAETMLEYANAVRARFGKEARPMPEPGEKKPGDRW